jgi:acyl-CoA synthetase (AMP-forming)/AMP-acid ligase II
VVLDEAFDASRTWMLLEEHAVARTFLAPTMLASLLAVEGNESRDCSNLQTIYTAYAFSPRERQRAVGRFGDVFVYMYGLTEAQLTCGAVDVFLREPSNVGRTMGVSRVAILAPDGTVLRPGEIGEIAFAGPSVMDGYHGLTAETDRAVRNGWVMTGDLGRSSTDGELHYAGRSKEMIKTGGFSVDPTEVENVLRDLDGVLDAAVVGTPDDYWGEAVVAFLVAESTTVDVEEVLARCRERLAGFKTPKAAFVLAELPHNATGKVERGRLRSLAQEYYT